MVNEKSRVALTADLALCSWLNRLRIRSTYCLRTYMMVVGFGKGASGKWSKFLCWCSALLFVLDERRFRRRLVGNNLQKVGGFCVAARFAGVLVG